MVEVLSEVLNRSGTLYSWARGVQQPQALRGRAPVFVATLPGAKTTTVVVRHAWHGGMLAPLTRDVFWRPSRAPVELHISHVLRQCGIPTPEFVAYALYRVAPGLVRVDVATEYIPESHDLAAVLADHVPDMSRAHAFEAIATLLRQLASNGFVHPDLNVKNVLLYRDNALLTAAVLDVDVMQHIGAQHAGKASQENYERFERSLRKSVRQFGVVLSEDEIATFRRKLLRHPLHSVV